MRRLPPSVLLICAALCAGAPAFAQVGATGSAARLRYTLGDLRPEDGQAPAVSFSPNRRDLYVGGSVSDAAGNILFQEGDDRNGPQDMAAGVEWRDVIRGSAVLAPGGVFDVDGGSVAGQLAAGREQTRFITSQLYCDEAFLLAPYSSLTLSIDVDVWAHVVPDGSWNQYASSSADIVGYGHFSDGQLSSQTVFDGAFAMAYASDTVTRTEAGEARTLAITLVNPNASWGDGYFYFDLGLNTQLQPLSPVPEPDRRVLLAGGLAALAMAARFRRRLSPA